MSQSCVSQGRRHVLNRSGLMKNRAREEQTPRRRGSACGGEVRRVARHRRREKKKKKKKRERERGRPEGVVLKLLVEGKEGYELVKK